MSGGKDRSKLRDAIMTLRAEDEISNEQEFIEAIQKTAKDNVGQDGPAAARQALSPSKKVVSLNASFAAQIAECERTAQLLAKSRNRRCEDIQAEHDRKIQEIDAESARLTAQKDDLEEKIKELIQQRSHLDFLIAEQVKIGRDADRHSTAKLEEVDQFFDAQISANDQIKRQAAAALSAAPDETARVEKSPPITPHQLFL